MRRSRVPRGWLLFALLVPCGAHAQSRDEATAEALFQEGRALVQRGAFGEACEKFEASEKLDPAVGTLLNIGDCMEHLGRTATAWARFREAEAIATEQHQPERAAIARGRAGRLEGRLCRLVVRAPADGGMPLTVTRDGVAVDPAAYGEALPVDPGAHTLAASAPGREPWSSRVMVGEGACPGSPVVVTVPALARVAAQPVPARAVPPLPVHGTAEESHGGARRAVAWTLLGLGGATLIASGALAIDAVSTYHGARDACTAAGCPDPSRSQAGTAGTLADWSTVTVCAGGALAAAGLVLWLTAPSTTVRVAPDVTPTAAGGARVGATARIVF